MTAKLITVTDREEDQEKREALLATLGLAFAGDPVLRWMQPDSSVFFEKFRHFCFEANAHAFAAGGATMLEDASAAAIWVPPGVEPEEERRTMAFANWASSERLEVLPEMGEAIAGYHPEGPHWYLSFIGTDPVRQGEGLGVRLMAPVLETCDREGLPAYLESSNPRNIPFYLRHGFEVMGEVRIGNPVPLTPMIRQPR